MINIKYLIGVIFISFALGLKAQDGKIIKGNESYESFSYTDCIKKFEGVSDKSYDVKKKLAESYYKTEDFINAENYYKDISSMSNSTSEDVYNYASVLKINKKYEDAELWMSKFSKLEQMDSRSKQFKQNKSYYNALLKDKAQFKITNLDINTQHQDFGTSYYMDKVVFASSRTSAKIYKRVWNWNELPFLDMFIADCENSKLVNVKPFKKTFNKKFHEGPASYNNAGDYMAYTRNNYNGKSKEGIVKLQIFTSNKVGENWENAIPVHFNSDEYSVGHPSLTADGKTMYFSSNMPGGLGGVDIYFVQKNDNGKWGNPENLGTKINTEGDEMFPFIHDSGILFFASKGLPGLGGLDIFVSTINENSISEPKNLGVPVNSSFDDFALIINSEMENGYFSSNRDNGKGNDDIYSFKLLKPFIENAIIKGFTKDTLGNIIANAKVNLFNADGDIINEMTSDENGAFEFSIPSDNNYVVEATKNSYVKKTEGFELKLDDKLLSKDIILTKLPDFNLLCKVSSNNLPISNATIVRTNNRTNKITSKNTNDIGNLFITLNDYNLKDSMDYIFVIEKHGYITKTVNYTQAINKFGEYIINIELEKIEVGEDLGEILAINPIYYDLDQSLIRADAKAELNKIVKIMNDNPTMEIELSSHTDCRATTIYNLKLSDKRAKASAHYIKTRITKPTRISGQGYGETKLINNCGCESNTGKGIDCSDEQHQENRRTEFKIIKK